MSEETSDNFFQPNLGSSFLKKSKTVICFSEVSNVNLPSHPLVFEIIIDFSLSSFELSGIGMSSNSARLSSDPGSPTGPLTGKRDSPDRERKINNAKVLYIS